MRVLQDPDLKDREDVGRLGEVQESDRSVELGDVYPALGDVRAFLHINRYSAQRS